MTPKLGFSKNVHSEQPDNIFFQNLGKSMDKILGNTDGVSKMEFLEVRNGESIQIQKTKLSHITMYTVSFKNMNIVTFYSNGNIKISYNEIIELFGNQTEAKNIIAKTINKYQKENSKTNKIKKETEEKLIKEISTNKGEKKLEGISEYKNHSELNTHINTILDFIIEKTKNDGKLDKETYICKLENTKVGNFIIINSEVDNINQTIKLLLDYNGKKIYINSEYYNRGPENSQINIGGIIYRFNEEKGKYLGYMDEEITITEEHFKILEELKAMPDGFYSVEDQELSVNSGI